MAKHPHKLAFIDGRTWRCVLDGCSFFVHRGLQHVLNGKNAICWQCDEIFRLDDDALKEDAPRCISCRTGVLSLEDIINKQIEEGRRRKREKQVEPDAVEVIEEDGTEK